MTLFNRNSGHNYLVSLITLLAIITVLAAVAFLLVYYLPGIFALSPFSYEAKELYSFEPWAFKLDQLEASYPEGGMILPLYRNEKQEAAIIIAEGEYRGWGQPLTDQKPAGVFLAVEENYFEEIRGSVIFLPLDDAETKQSMASIHEQQFGLPVIWQKVIPLTFKPAAGSVYYYFISEQGKAMLPPSLNEPPAKYFGSLALYAIVIIIFLLMMTVFSLDHRPSRYWELLYRTQPGKKALPVTAAVIGLAFGGELLPLCKCLPESSFLIGYVPAIAMLMILGYLKIIDLWDTGINRNALQHGYLTAIVTAAAFAIITRGIPRQFPSGGLKTVGTLLFSILIAGLARELIWRGYIQTILGRQWGAGTGLLLTAFLAGLVHFATVALGSPELLCYPYTLVELLILAPGSAVILGYLYLRTENILCCALLHGLLLSLSSLIII